MYFEQQTCKISHVECVVPECSVLRRKNRAVCWTDCLLGLRRLSSLHARVVYRAAGDYLGELFAVLLGRSDG